MKRVAAVHDMSGIGKCSLTAALPIISCAGIECNPVPTAILSTHTGNISGFTFRDLTDDIPAYYKHWKSLGIVPDTIYSGYLGSINQIESVCDMIDLFASETLTVVVDPAMADSGKLYTGFNKEFVSKMAELCKKADIITPNLTEAAFLTDTEYKTEHDTHYYIDLVKQLGGFTKRYVVLTGVSDNEEKTGCLIYDKTEDFLLFINSDKCPGTYYGTGDIFTSVLTAGITKGFPVDKAAEIALDFTYKSILETCNEGTDPRFGVAFENYLGDLSADLGDYYEFC